MKGIIILGTLCLYIACAEGLKCYNCLYLSDKLPDGLSLSIPSESSCKPGKKPDKKFSVDCSQIGYSRSSENVTGVLNILTSVFGNNHPLISEPSQAGANVTYTCGKLSYDGNFISYYKGKKMTAMFRTCIRKISYTNATFQQQCQNGKMDKLNIQDPDVRQIVFNAALGPFMNVTQTDASICTCTKDDCNGAMLNAQISIFVLLASLMAVLLR